MPLIHTRTFRVRSYECDAYGNLNNANYLRFMQETAFDASAAAGYDLKRYAEMERLWLIHQTDVEYLCHLHYNDRVEVKTWIADFRRISSRRGYEFRLAGTDQLVAQAHTDWVFLDSVTNQPATIPKTLALDFYPEGLPETYPARKPFPKATPPPPGVFRTHRKVEWGDLDSVQHVNNAIYLDYLAECGAHALAAYGWSHERMAAEGFGVFLHRIQIKYSQPALGNDDLEITTWFSNIQRTTATRHFIIRRTSDKALIAQAHALIHWVNLVSGKPVGIQEEMLADISSNIT